MIENSRELTNSKRQTYTVSDYKKSLSEIQELLNKQGINGFVVKLDGDKVTMLVQKQDIKANRGAYKHVLKN